MEIRHLPQVEISRIAEIDRSEHVTVTYEYQDGNLRAKTVDWRVPNWSADASDDHSFHALIRQFAPILEEGGVLLGAFEGDQLAGLAVLRYEIGEGTSQLALLHVSRPYRRQGIGTRLTEEMIRLAKESGASEIYVSATPSESAVGFYLSHGFELAAKVNKELYALEPEDIHMTRAL